MQNTNSEQLHKEHESWLNELTLWHNELMFYDRMLLRLAAMDVPKSDTDQMEEFKSRFDNLQEKFTTMRAAIENHERSLHNGGSVESHADAHNVSRENIHVFEKEFKALKNDFFVFSDKEDY